MRHVAGDHIFSHRETHLLDLTFLNRGQYYNP